MIIDGHKGFSTLQAWSVDSFSIIPEQVIPTHVGEMYAGKLEQGLCTSAPPLTFQSWAGRSEGSVHMPPRHQKPCIAHTSRFKKPSSGLPTQHGTVEGGTGRVSPCGDIVASTVFAAPKPPHKLRYPVQKNKAWVWGLLNTMQAIPWFSSGSLFSKIHSFGISVISRFNYWTGACLVCCSFQSLNLVHLLLMCIPTPSNHKPCSIP